MQQKHFNKNQNRITVCACRLAQIKLGPLTCSSFYGSKKDLSLFFSSQGKIVSFFLPARLKIAWVKPFTGLSSSASLLLHSFWRLSPPPRPCWCAVILLHMAAVALSGFRVGDLLCKQVFTFQWEVAAVLKGSFICDWHKSGSNTYLCAVAYCSPVLPLPPPPPCPVLPWPWFPVCGGFCWQRCCHVFLLGKACRSTAVLMFCEWLGSSF